jgi:arylsulfatase/uncharacterized sulfatase
LFDMLADPGETHDLQARLPQVHAAMQKAYDAWAEANGVLPMPAGYDPAWQVTVNSMLNYFVPRYGPPAGAVLVLLAGWLWWRRRRACARARGRSDAGRGLSERRLRP